LHEILQVGWQSISTSTSFPVFVDLS